MVASAAPAMAASGVVPFFQLVAPCVNPAGACIRKEAGYGFLVRVCGQGTQSAYLYSVTIMSPQVSDLTFDSIEPPLGRGITPGNCTNTFFNARTSTLPPAIFTATISVTCGHTLRSGRIPTRARGDDGARVRNAWRLQLSASVSQLIRSGAVSRCRSAVSRPGAPCHGADGGSPSVDHGLGTVEREGSCLVAVVAGDRMRQADIGQGGLLRGADRRGQGTARVEPAAARWVRG